MKTLAKIVFWTINVVAIAECVPVVITDIIITNIKHESDEAYYRRCYRMMRWYFRIFECSENDFIDLCRTKAHDK